MGGLHYDIDLEDLQFILFDQLDVDVELKAIPKYADFDQAVYEATLEEARRIAVEVLAPINRSGDREGCRLEPDGTVVTPKGYREAWKTISEGGWVSVSAPPEAGGPGLPSVMSMAVIEMFIGAAMAFEMYPGLTAAAARVIFRHGPPGRGDAWAKRMFSGVWAGTMCLTEAGAGSDVGENRCKAEPVAGEPGAFTLEGEKIFISGGDHDLTENIVHLVLARTPGSPSGTKGLSLFMVPKHLVNDDLSPATRNGARVTKIEEKLGIHGSATCVLELGGNAACKGWLVGEEHAGIRLMFEMMNEARIGVGMQGIAMAGTAYHYALQYARERLQGSSAERFRDPEAPRVPIVEHPDVRRMLMTMKVYAETSRSMCYGLGHRLDVAENDPAKRDRYVGRVELLVPILKAHCTDLGFEACVTAVQVLGGYGYIGEYPVEQLLRDAKITSIYEGTNGIQALDLLARKLRMNGGALLMEWVQDAVADCALGRQEGFAAEADALEKAVQACGQTAMHLGAVGQSGNLDATLLHAYPFLQMMGWTQLGLEALHQARVAKKAISERGETPHRKGKLLNLTFYVANLLPQAIALAKRVQSSDATCLDPSLFGGPA
jgi:alkylation response protein AidB-like acyl-CoA dehydrogenase